MKKQFPALVLIILSQFLSANSFSQPFQVSFQPVNEELIIDSVIAINLTTSDTIFISGGDTITLTSILTKANTLPFSTEINTVFPNPFETSTTLKVSIEKSELIFIGLYSQTGQLLARNQDFYKAGIHTFSISSRAVGIHFLHIKSNSLDESIKLISTKSNGSENQIINNGLTSSLENNKTAQFKSAQFSKELRYHGGDVLHYEAFSGGKSTILTDSPIQDKVYFVDFYTCTDGDGKNYPAVKIGEQVWMAENLAFLPEVDSASHFSYTEPYYYVSGYNGNNIESAKANSNYKIFGVLYNWPAALAACPNGWHLPTNDEWDELAEQISTENGGYTKGEWYWENVGTHLRTKMNWYTNGIDDYGFSGLPGGRRFWNGLYEDLYEEGCWWSATEGNSTASWYWKLDNSSWFIWSNINNEVGFSVRCLKD